MELKLIKYLLSKPKHELIQFIDLMKDEIQMSEIIELINEHIKCFD